MPFRDGTRVMMTHHAFGLGKCLDLELLLQLLLLLMNGCFLCAVAARFFAGAAWRKPSHKTRHTNASVAAVEKLLVHTTLAKVGKKNSYERSALQPLDAFFAVLRNFLKRFLPVPISPRF
jgi:hypothetical protein